MKLLFLTLDLTFLQLTGKGITSVQISLWGNHHVDRLKMKLQQLGLDVGSSTRGHGRSVLYVAACVYTLVVAALF